MSEVDVLLRSGSGPSGSAASDVEAPADVDEALGDGDAVALVTEMLSAAAGGVHVAVVVTEAVAVRVTAVTDVSEEATGICAFRSVACLSDTEPTVHVAVPFPLSQPLVNVGFWLVGAAVSATDTSDAVPFSVETSTTYAASFPRSMLVAERWTATHSSAWSELVGLGLVAVSAAETVPVAEPEAEAEADPEAVAEVDATAAVSDGDSEPDGLGLRVDAADADGEADDEALGDGDGEPDELDEGDGDGVGVAELEAGSASQVVSVLLVAFLLTEAAVSACCALARARLGRAAAIPITSKPPASKLSNTALSCARRI